MATTNTRLTGWRRIANAVLYAPSNPQILGAFELDVRPALAYLARAHRAGHRHVELVHLVGRAVAHAIDVVPAVDLRLRRGDAPDDPTIDVFFIHAIETDYVYGAKIHDVSGRAAADIAHELARRVPDLYPPRRFLDTILRPTLFGSAIVGSLDVFGLPPGFAPAAWMFEVPLIVLTGRLDGTKLPITVTFDHRFVDSAKVEEAMTPLRHYLNVPGAFEPWVHVPHAEATAHTISASETGENES